MSRKTEVLCDRCGKEISAYDIKLSSARIDIWAPGTPRSYTAERIDFCEECYQKFIDFFETEGDE